ncbi:MAG: hypothetical protein GXP36_09275 [Actinobacteria bacterium]|nr:hypothetical protein [Actinomycetota bacterium]
MESSELERCVHLVGHTLSTKQREQLTSYAAWLADEAIVAGGIGPDEGTRLWDRHILDSAAFVAVLDDRLQDGVAIVDIGSGVGLPGIVLAILLPDTPVTLLDRSQRRHGLQRRAIRILDLQNCDSLQRDVPAQPVPRGVRVFRASLTPGEVLSLHVGSQNDHASIVALTRRTDGVLPDDLRTAAAAAGVDVRLHGIGADILDSPAWFLSMVTL